MLFPLAMMAPLADRKPSNIKELFCDT